MKRPEITREGLKKELLDLNQLILNTSIEGCERIRKRESMSAINSALDFLRNLWRRRDIILHELGKMGVDEKEINTACEEDKDALA